MTFLDLLSDDKLSRVLLQIGLIRLLLLDLLFSLLELLFLRLDLLKQL